jgi:hypothetical protein
VNFAHLHLLLNHVPTVGSVVALGLLLLAYARRNDHLRHAGLEVLVVIAILTLPAYTTGVAAQREIRDRPEISNTTMMRHQDAALAGFAATEFAGFIAWIALWQSRRRSSLAPDGPRTTPGLVPAVTLLLFVALALMGRAATIGGEIRHPEILTAAANVSNASTDSNAFVAAAISDYMVNSRWAWPAAEALHFLAFALAIGVLLVVNFRILGLMRQVSFADVHRLLPWGMLAFGVNLITGMLFFVGQPAQYVDNVPFYWKIVFLMIAGMNFLYLTVFGKAWTAAGFESNLADKAMAVTSLAAWIGVLYAGRMLPFLGNAF